MTSCRRCGNRTQPRDCVGSCLVVALHSSASDLRLLQSVQLEIDKFDKRLADLAWEDERVKLLMTIPGVSVVVGQAVVAASGDIPVLSQAMLPPVISD